MLRCFFSVPERTDATLQFTLLTYKQKNRNENEEATP